MDNKDLIWNQFLNMIKKRVSSLGYDTWFRDTKLVELSDDAIITVPTIAHQKHLAESYKDIIEEILNSITGTNFNLNFVLENEYKKQEEIKEKRNKKKQEYLLIVIKRLI